VSSAGNIVVIAGRSLSGSKLAIEGAKPESLGGIDLHLCRDGDLERAVLWGMGRGVGRESFTESAGTRENVNNGDVHA